MIRKQHYFITISVSLTILLLIASIVAYFFYQQYRLQVKFLSGVASIETFRSSDNKQVKRIVTFWDPDSFKNSILLTNANLERNSSKVVVMGIAPGVIRQQNVNFYNKNYAIIEYGIGEGAIDYLIFDQEGKVITKSLLQDYFRPPQVVPYIRSVSTRENGELILETEENNSQRLVFDFTTGKLKKTE